jgi:hypothetical protein
MRDLHTPLEFKVLVAGGVNGINSLDSAELFTSGEVDELAASHRGGERA